MPPMRMTACVPSRIARDSSATSIGMSRRQTSSKQRDADLVAGIPHLVPIGVVPQQAVAVAEPVGHAVDIHDAGGDTVAVARHRQHQVVAQDAAKRAAVLRNVLAGRQKRQDGRHHLRRAVEQACDRRAAAQVLRHRHAIGLHDEHAPVAPVIRRYIRLRRHDVVKTRHMIEHAGDAERLAADVAPALGEAFGVGEIMLRLERGRRRDAAVVNGADHPRRPVIKLPHASSPQRLGRSPAVTIVRRRGPAYIQADKFAAAAQ